MTNIARLPERTPKPVNELVGMNVSIAAQRRGITQKDLAEAIGVTQTSMSRRISGTTDWSPDEMERVARILRVEVARLFVKLPDLDSNQEPIGLQTAAVVSLTERRAQRDLRESARATAEA
jgi:transcriptional regulator with XRE-family HTH domain